MILFSMFIEAAIGIAFVLGFAFYIAIISNAVIAGVITVVMLALLIICYAIQDEDDWPKGGGKSHV